MITVESVDLNGIPALKIEKAEFNDRPLPLVVFWHGVSSVKERNLYYGYLLAEKGLRVIMPEAMEHGERRTDLSEPERQAAFFSIVMTGIKETVEIKQFCERQKWIESDRFSLAGTSMGAIITLGALAAYDGIKSAVALMGTPYLVGFARQMLASVEEMGMELPFSYEEINRMMKHLEPFDLSKHPEKLKGVPLLFWHGQKDTVVPYQQSRLFYDSYHTTEGVHMNFIRDKQAGHVVTHEGAIAMRNWLVENT